MTRPKNTKVSKHQSFIKENSLTILTIIGVISGLAIGMILKSARPDWTKRELSYIGFPGEIFLRMLKCLIVPLLVSSITSAIGGLDLRRSGRIAVRSIIYYLSTTVSAVILGIILVMSIQPGKGARVIEQKNDAEQASPAKTQDTLMDLIRNMFSDNIIKSCLFQFKTDLKDPNNDTIPIELWEMKGTEKEGFNVLGLVVFSVVLGVTLSRMAEQGKVVQDFLVTLSEAMMIITSWVIWLSPLGVGFLIAQKVLEMSSIIEVVTQLGWYFLTVMIGLFLHGFGTIALIFFIATRQLPYKYIIKMAQVLATAFGTGSSSATMPITIRTLDNMGINPSVTRFVIPVGATINMDGTALYEAVAALFIAQYRNKSYSLGTVIAVSITATAASIGAAGIPSAGLVTMVMVLDTVGLPASDVSLIIAVDWLLDRFRTTINVMCDALGAILVNHLSKADLADIDKANAEPHELLELGGTANGDRKE